MAKSKLNPTKFVLMVKWCNVGPYGVFCDNQGQAHWEPDRPQTMAEMCEILGPFWLILNPVSRELSEADLEAYHNWIPLAEYSHVWGIACTDEEQQRMLSLDKSKAREQVRETIGASLEAGEGV